MTDRYNLRSGKGKPGGMNGEDGGRASAVNAEGDSSSSSSEMSVADKMSLMQLQLQIAEAELEKQRLLLETQRLQNSSAVSVVDGRGGLGGAEEDRRLKYASLLKGVLAPMPTHEPLVPGWFEDVEATLDSYGVPDEWWAGMVLPRLSERARGMLAKLSAEERKDYRTLKSKVLGGLRLSAAEYRRLFLSSRKGSKETWEQFSVRLENYLQYYLNSSKVQTMEELQQLMVSDRMKECLAPDARAHVILKEKGGFLTPSAIAQLSEDFDESLRSKGGSATDRGATTKKPNTEARDKDGRSAAPFGRRCFGCNKPGHIAKDCPTRNTNPSNRMGKRNEEKDRTLAAMVSAIEFEVEPRTAPSKECSGGHTVSLKSGDVNITAIVDSGADISVIRQSILRDYEAAGSRIELTSAFGDRVTAELAYVPLSAVTGGPYVSLQPGSQGVLCALTERLVEGVDALITPSDYEQLLSERVCTDSAPRPMGSMASKTVEKGGEIGERSLEAEMLTVMTEERETGSGANPIARHEFRRCQESDTTLDEAWKQARVGTHGMVVMDELLYHCEPVAGRSCNQLVIPKGRREEVLRMAHDSAWAGHLGERKTLQRIKQSFYWPGVAADVKAYCQSCHTCQVRSPARQSDRVPIVPLTRSDAPFQMVNMDIIGPLDPPSGRGHRNALCVVDYCTRWPEVICLRSLTAKATCDALLEIFSRMGVPETVCSDQGTNFTAKLTQELMARLGATPRFSTPDHPQSNGLVERWNGTFKAMLSHVVQEHGRDWDRYIPYLLWAYREVPNATTGETPFEMMYGRVPIGPLAILQKTWTGEWTVPDSLNVSAGTYLSQLRKRLESASERAKETGALTQEAYANRYNLRARDKQFSDGDQVLWSEKEKEGKLRPKWTGPVTIVRRLRPYSYEVELEDRSRRTVHANNLRAYHSRVSVVGVIFEEDRAFGDVPTLPSAKGNKESGELPTVAHLTKPQQYQLKALVEKNRVVFSERPGMCNVGKHKITLQEGSEPQRAYPYRVPMAFRREVERQVHELEEWGLVYPVESSHAHPVEYILATDASQFAIGACLAQEDDNGKERPIAFLSRKLTPAETRWATIEREAFAIIWALQRLETWLFAASIKTGDGRGMTT
ncbi:uncharacterized protein LOC121837594 [Ixodes scapularis]|uniref:uncharacterized protein LOC121837594 n=1 Tax=Ixodes scapularis TaxID=6945 RepID=UPI001C38755C|nr:uncharacterized protein LOC121837594 [Ixodes scapularis]